jgi:hypothetical protein
MHPIISQQVANLKAADFRREAERPQPASAGTPRCQAARDA